MAVLLDAVTAQGNSFSPTLSFLHTPVGIPSAVGFYLTWADNGVGNPDVVTYGGVNMPFVTAAASGGTINLYGLPSPPAGPQTANIHWNTSNPFSIILAVVTVTGSDPSTCFSAFNGTSTLGGPLSVTVASNPGELVVDMSQGYVTGATNPTGGGGQTLLWADINEHNQDASGSYVNATGPTTTSWSYTSANPASLVSSSFKLAPSGLIVPTWAEVVLGG